MPNLIVFEERRVTAKGIDKNNQINEDKIKDYFFDEDYANLKLLDNICLNSNKKKVTLLYPGCGYDIFFPLLYLEKLFPAVTEAELNFVDYENNFCLIKTLLNEVGVSFSEQSSQLQFYWKNILVTLNFILKKIEDFFLEMNEFDIYFERAFRIMRDEIKDYEPKIMSKLKVGGILISDSGFEETGLQKIPIPKQLSSYGEMIIGVKK